MKVIAENAYNEAVNKPMVEGAVAVRLVKNHSDEALIATVDACLRQALPTGVLLCKFSLGLQPVQSDAVLAAAAPVIANHNGALYFLKNNDVLIVWQGPLAQVESTLKNVVRGHFRGMVTKIGESRFFQFFDLREHAASVRALVLAPDMPVPVSEEAIPAAPAGPAQLMFSEEQATALKQLLRDRNSARGISTTGLNIMVMEDQEFSLKLLKTLLSREHQCITAQTAAEAIALYAQQPPDILFLDVELPDCNGHEFAKFIRQHDPDSHIIMVTANSAAKDVYEARRNAVQGYITKPFRQQKILASVDAFIARYSA